MSRFCPQCGEPSGWWTQGNLCFGCDLRYQIQVRGSFAQMETQRLQQEQLRNQQEQYQQYQQEQAKIAQEAVPFSQVLWEKNIIAKAIANAPKFEKERLERLESIANAPEIEKERLESIAKAAEIAIAARNARTVKTEKKEIDKKDAEESAKDTLKMSSPQERIDYFKKLSENPEINLRNDILRYSKDVLFTPEEWTIFAKRGWIQREDLPKELVIR